MLVVEVPDKVTFIETQKLSYHRSSVFMLFAFILNLLVLRSFLNTRRLVTNMTKFWIGVASKDHVENGIKWGIAQFCHGKKGPSQKLKRGDFVVYYSPKVAFGGKESCQKFTAIGKVLDDKPYEFDMGNGFVPYRRDIQYFEGSNDVDVKQMVDSLPFIKNKSAWGAVFRFGLLEIDHESFRVIAKEMIGMDPSLP